MLKFKAQLKEEIAKTLKGKYSIDPSELEINYTPQISMGDLALTFPFQLAKKLKSQPRTIAQEVIPLLHALKGIQKVEVAGAGYINLFMDRKAFFSARLHSLSKTSLSQQEKKIIIEHTNINPNKAAHIGHLRNACLGDSLGRCLKYKGENVEIQNYIDDTGVQVADVVFGFMDLEKKGIAEIREIKEKFDFYCWDLYTQVSSYLEKNPQVQKRRSEILKKIEIEENPEYEIANYISRQIIKAHLSTMRRINVSYDLLPCESSILQLHFWEKAFSLLKEKKGVYLSTTGENEGCWVMGLENDTEKEKIIVRSDGTVTYVGKDIAYQLWKFGLLERDFHYEPFIEEDGRTIWITTAQPKPDSPRFGKGSRVYNVIDQRQSYLQKIVVQGLRALNYMAQAEKSIHFSYEMVALSPKSLRELSLEVSEEDKEKNFLEVSGRKGLGIKADDLLDRLEEKALTEVEKRNPELSSDRQTGIAHDIACGALRYFMLKFTRNSLIVFDFEDALNFEGETGPYLQYTLVRINSIFRKLEEREGFEEEDIQPLISSGKLPLDLLTEAEQADFWELVLYASQFEEEILHSIYSLEFSHLAKFSFNLCQKFNTYYHIYPVLAEKNREVKNIRILTIHYVKEVLGRALSLMGIPRPERM
ncbi:MAG: arginine--tRNA ligase [Candidatus Aminicenantes bacterium]|nr:MAG: arginine--tRNA ligase [Candidatus Aminicenantes bacterium]